ncbi:MAG: hypothetical protein QF886_13680, partial [Planctomycetota bacterium]|nr:hypothetical protein [Planctomycetota bacterium]
AGLKRYWDALPASFQKKLVSFVKPKFAVEIDGELKTDPKAGELRRAILAMIDWQESHIQALLNLPEDHPAAAVSSVVSAQKFIRFVLPTLAACIDLDRWLPSLTPRQKRLKEIAKALGSREFHMTLMAEILQRLDVYLGFHNRPDECVFWLDWVIRDSGTLKIFTLHLKQEKARPEAIEVDGESRRIYPCIAPVGPHLHRIHWTAEKIGLGDVDREYPVYVQQHALRRLTERLDCLHDWEGIANDGLILSLDNPVITSGSGGDLLAEYRLMGHKVGYMPAAIFGDKVVIRTFLFLTMDGTPEGRKLYEKLHLTGKERNHLKWDRLSTFQETDLGKDQELHEILEECGCGHLFDVLPDFVSRDHKPGFAEDARQYLGMAKPASYRERLAASLGAKLE